MKKLLLFSVFLVSVIVVFGQNGHDKHESVDACETCKVTSNQSEKTVSYHQYISEEFNETEFKTKYMIQYAVVSEVITMPTDAMAISFYTNEGLMYMIVSTKQYNNRAEAVAAAERAKSANQTFCNYFVKPCMLSKPATVVQKSNVTTSNQVVATTSQTKASPSSASPYEKRKFAYVEEKVIYSPEGAKVEKEEIRSEQKTGLSGKFRIQYTWTKDYPFTTMSKFMVERHRGGYRQVSTLSFTNKADATQWLRNQGLAVKNFWIYPL